MTDADLQALNLFEEAANQPYEGMVAVQRVVCNRMAQRYESDGTAAGTVLKYDQFSWAYFEMVGGHYTRVCDTPDEAAARAESLLSAAKATDTWIDCAGAVTDGQIGSFFQGGPQWRLLNAEPRTLLYVNLAVSNPAWATPDMHVAKIFAHDFYRA